LNWTIKVSSKAEKYFNKLDADTKSRIKKELLQLAAYPNPLDHNDTKPLTGELKGFYRLRVGGYRVVYAILKESRTIAVVNIAPRGNIYK
jgi:mRNA interferase RelE/StbE